MKKHLILFLLATIFLVFDFEVIAQNNPGGHPGGGPPGKQIPKIGTIYGKVIDKQSGEPIEFATIAIEHTRFSKVVGGGISDKKGKFSIAELPPGKLILRVTFIGYKTSSSDTLFITREQTLLDAGTFSLEASSIGLSTVEVTAEKDMLLNSIDKKVFTVEKNITAEGASASEVLDNIPSITVDIDGNVSLRGNSNVTILIDGKPSSLSGASRAEILEQIPASTIENIEVITNPSAKYDPDGLSGIINIVLKKNKLQGINGMVTGSAGIGDKYNGSFNVNYRKKWINVFANAGYNSREMNGHGYSLRENNIGDTTFYFNSYQTGGFKRAGVMAKGGVDFFLNEKTSITLSTSYNSRNGGHDQYLEYNYLDENMVLSDLYYRDVEEVHPGFGSDYALNFSKRFAKQGRSLSSDIIWSDHGGNETQRAVERYYNTDGTSMNIPNGLFDQFSKDKSNELIAQIDYTHPTEKYGKFETGWKSTYQNTESDFHSESFDNESNTWVIDTLSKNEFGYTEAMHSGYFMYGNSFKWLDVQAGLRVEQTYVTSKLLETGVEYENDYFSLFPSMHVAKKLPKEHTIGLSYSRRIERPDMHDLNPFVDRGNPLELRVGNPYLKPEYIDSYEINYEKSWNKASLTSAIYYRETHDMMSRFKTVDSLGISTTTYANIYNSTSYGFEFVSVIPLTKWWDINGSVNIYRAVIDASNLETDLNNDAFSWFGKGISTMQFKYDISFQVSGNYRAPIAISQGTINAMYAVDVAIKKNILKKKGSISFRASDIFNTRGFSMNVAGTNFTQESLRKRESRQYYISFSYRFGKMDFSKKRDRRNNGGGDDGGGMDVDME
ncbi:MAG: TonB-dependent receptor family protein [Bacteroidetes bacterium]|nr:TonB-dependent receptor family protein [Bacteroidota bacterium]MBU1719281.1 TonB-dependent receptor family protein [Bacteroidota bacterium]